MHSLTSLFLPLSQLILRQLVNAAKELHYNQCIFHRDIKLENILLETTSGVPRVRIIDFGLGCFAQINTLYENFRGMTFSFYKKRNYLN